MARAGVASAVRQWDAVRAFALRFPGAFEDFPWGKPVIKVATGSKWPPLFLWLGLREAPAPAVYMKLTESYDDAVAIARAFPTPDSGVGRYGRLSIPLPVPDIGLLYDWVDESYRNVAPRALVAQLDANPPAPGGGEGLVRSGTGTATGREMSASPPLDWAPIRSSISGTRGV